jgi:hypothetical protein
MHAALQNVEFGFVHDPAQTQKQTIVVVRRIV